MKPGARIQAAIEVLEAVITAHQPAATALSDWGKAHRFAGSGDRSAIGNLVYDALRKKQSIGHRFESDRPRALAIGAAPSALGLDSAGVIAACDGSKHAPEPLSQQEVQALRTPLTASVTDEIAADIPPWLRPALHATFQNRLVEEGRAMAERAPIDLRVNTLRTTRDQVLAELADTGAEAGSWCPTAVRIPPPIGAQRAPNIEAEAAHGRGWFEVQDQGSQIAASFVRAASSERVLDLCAGAGGKTLALAAQMQNQGELLAFDSDKSRLRPIFERVTRSGATNVTVLRGGDLLALEALNGTCDAVLVDAPCSGSGTWRRKPDAKWRLKPDSLAQRTASQIRVLDMAAKLVRPGGRLIYVTCSVLAEENTAQISTFFARHSNFRIEPWRDAWRKSALSAPPDFSADRRDDTLLLTPASHGTDGFFIASLTRNA